MVLELHIWGPAFGLPSIDPECLATILYLNTHIGPQGYSLIPDSDPGVNPWGELPALCDNDVIEATGPLWIAGYRDILKYVQSHGDTRTEITTKQTAEQTAFTEYVQTRGRELIDLSLWVSSENYTNVTRGAINELLTWPNSWTIPSRLRDRARARTEHLGLSGYDVDVAAEEQARRDRPAQGLDSQIPSGLKRAGSTVSHLLGQGSRGHQFKLAALADNFFEAISDLKGDNVWLMETADPTGLDCLTLGYLLLISRTEVPHDWLRFALRERFPELGKWAENRTRDIFGARVAWVNRNLVVDTGSNLPWQKLPKRTWRDLSASILDNITTSLPLIGPAYLHPTLEDNYDAVGTKAVQGEKQSALVTTKARQLLYSQIFTSFLGLAALTGFLFWKGLLGLPGGIPRRGKRDFGAAGAMLGL